MQISIKTRVFVAAIGIALVVLLILFFLSKNSLPQNNESGIKPLPIPSDIAKDYSNLYRVVPGKSSRDDVEKVNGAPFNVSTFGDKTYLYYKTPLDEFENVVLLVNNKVLYSYENVFGTYRGMLRDYTDSYGEALLKMYKKDDPYVWFIYPDKGLAVESDEKDVLVVVYFIPTTAEGFIKDLAPELKLQSEQPPTSE